MSDIEWATFSDRTEWTSTGTGAKATLWRTTPPTVEVVLPAAKFRVGAEGMKALAELFAKVDSKLDELERKAQDKATLDAANQRAQAALAQRKPGGGTQ